MRGDYPLHDCSLKTGCCQPGSELCRFQFIDIGRGFPPVGGLLLPAGILPAELPVGKLGKNSAIRLSEKRPAAKKYAPSMTDRVFLSTVSHRGSISGFIHRVSPIRYGSTMAKRLSFCAKALPSIGEVPQSRRYCHGTQIRFSSSVISLPKSRVLPRFAAICRAEIVVNNL